MPSHPPDDGLSEVVGFVLILGVIVVALSLYQVYGVPAAGREDEIRHMNAVKDRFIDYKIALDSLWLGSADTMRSGEGVTLGTSFDLGTEGGGTRNGGVVLPIFVPVPSSGAVSVNEYRDSLTVTSNGTDVKVLLDPMGEVAYRAANNYWIEQRYFYQAGGLFLAQDSGTTARVSPPISLYVADNGADGSPEYRLRMKIVAIQVFGGQTAQGRGVARIDTRLREGMTKTTATGSGNITVTVDAHDEETAKAWRQVFIDAAIRGGVAWGTEDDALPVRIVWQPGETQVSMICRPEAESAGATRIRCVDLDATCVGFSVALQQAVLI